MGSGILTESIHFRDYLRTIRKHFKLIVSCFLVVLATVALGTYLQRPIYRATTKALIERDGPRLMNSQEATPDSIELFQTNFQTEAQVIRSRSVAQRVIDRLDLLKRKPELAEVADPVQTFLKAVTVEPVRNTRLIEIKVEDPDPKLAAEMANNLASAYVNQNRELRIAATREAVTWLTAQVSDLKTKMNESELTLQKYQEEAGLVSVEEKQSLAARNLAEASAGYHDAKAKRLEMETRLGELRKASQHPEELESAPIVINNPLIQRLKGQLVELEVQRSKLLKTYKGRHPDIVEMQSQVDEISQRIKQEVSRLVLSVESEYRALKARENAMLATVNQYRDEVQRLGKKEIQSGTLRRDASSNQQLYELLLKRLKESGLTQGLEPSNVRIVELAAIPAIPVTPRKVLNLAIGCVMGLGLGLFLAFFIEYMDDTVRTPQQVERALGVTVLALIPVLSVRNRS